MTRPDRHFPEIYRYCKQEAGRVRLVSGFAGATALCLAAAFLVKHTTGSWYDFLKIVTFMQFNMLLFYGTLCTAKSVTQERAARTWDFQRLTPLSAFRLAAGKFLGAPVFPWFLAASMLPAGLAAGLLGTGIQTDFLCRYALGITASLLFMAAGLLASSYDETGGSGAGFLSGPLLGLVGLSVLNTGFRYRDQVLGLYPEPMGFYGYTLGYVPGVTFLSVSFLVFAAWAFLGARYRIGRDLLEKRRLWRMPAFMFFLAWYAAGMAMADNSRPPTAPVSALLLPALAAYISAVLSGERREYWRRWLSPGGRLAARLDEAPAWLKGTAAVFLIAAVLAGINFFTGLFGPPTAFWRAFVLLPLFLLRDMMFLQWCRFSNSRRPEVMALIYIALAYALPGMILGPTGMKTAMPYFVPYVYANISAAANLAGPLAQVLVMGYFLYRKTKGTLVSI